MNLTITDDMTIKYITGGNEYILDRMILNENGTNNIVYEASGSTPTIDYSTQYFTIESLKAGNVITFTIGAGVQENDLYVIRWSKDLVNWNSCGNESGVEKVVTINADIENVYFRGQGKRLANGVAAETYCTFYVSGDHNVSGNICSLVYDNDFSSVTSSTANYQFAKLFENDIYLLSAKNLILPFTSVTGSYTFHSMFYGCQAMEEAPELILSTLTQYCYYYMFYQCISLRKIVCLATNISASKCTYYWTRWIPGSGTFYKHPSMTSWTTGQNGIPSGWTVENYVA